MEFDSGHALVNNRTSTGLVLYKYASTCRSSNRSLGSSPVIKQHLDLDIKQGSLSVSQDTIPKACAGRPRGYSVGLITQLPKRPFVGN